jgi:hypothetical protein
MPSSSIYLQRTIRVISFILLLISLAILALTGHATWLLNKYFPSGAWYIWRGLDATTYVEQQTPQQWVTVAYDSTTERLAIMRAVLGVVASVLGILAAWSREVDVKVCSHTSRKTNRERKKEYVLINVGAQTPHTMLTKPLHPHHHFLSHSIHQHTSLSHLVTGPAIPSCEEMQRTNHPHRVLHQVSMQQGTGCVCDITGDCER